MNAEKIISDGTRFILAKRQKNHGFIHSTVHSAHCITYIMNVI